MHTRVSARMKRVVSGWEVFSRYWIDDGGM